MYVPRKPIRLALCSAAVLLLTGSCFAAGTDYNFSARDFSGTGGIVLTALPDETQGVLRCGSRTLRTGDVIPAGAYSTLSFTSCPGAEAASISYLPVSNGRTGPEQSLTLQVFGRKTDQAPTARDCELETYKNIPNSGTLSAEDPEGGALTYTVAEEPRRGAVSIAPDGSFTYTPDRNKVGKDSFTYTVTDAAGNVSQPATVTIRIRKPGDKATFSDMAGQDGEFYAMWIKDQGLLTGEQIAGSLCFRPEQTVSRGEFVVLVMQLFDLEPSGVTTSSFADAKDTPVWMQSYLSSAVAAGFVSGIQSDRGMVFRASSPITQAEAAVMLQKLLRLPAAASIPAGDVQEVWAYDSVEALHQSGISALSCSAEPLTRLSCAKLLWQASRAADTGRYGLLAWAAD